MNPASLATVPEHCTKAGAVRLAERLEDYWAVRGFGIKAWVEPLTHDGTPWHTRGGALHGGSDAPAMYGVRSSGVPVQRGRE